MDAERRMQCMEVWGGSMPADSHLALSGLDVWVYSRPFGQAPSGGDVYYFSSCATGRISRLLLADVSGHGQQVASIADDLRTLMQQYVNYLDQTQFVRKINERFANAAMTNGHFATAVVLSFFATNNHLSLSNAGHPPPLHYRARANRWALVERHGNEMSDLPLGLDPQSTYSQSELALGDDDLLLTYSDALIDARDADGNTISPETLLDIINALPAAEPPALIAQLLHRLAELHPENLDGDDLTAILIRPTGALKHLPLSRKLMAPFRFARQAARSLLRREPVAWPEWNRASIGGFFCDALGRTWSGCGCGKRTRER